MLVSGSCGGTIEGFSQGRGACHRPGPGAARGTCQQAPLSRYVHRFTLAQLYSGFKIKAPVNKV